MYCCLKPDSEKVKHFNEIETDPSFIDLIFTVAVIF